MSTKPELTFTCTPGLYEIKGSTLDIKDQLSCRILQLEAMLATTAGEQGDTFRMLNDDLQGNFLWACSSVIREIRQLYGALQAEEYGDATGTDPT